MPVEPRTVDFTTGEAIQIVRIGQRINGLTAQRVPRGLTYGVKFGNNPVIPGFGRGTFPQLGSNPDSDIKEGVWIVPVFPAPLLTVDFMVSFTT